MASIKSNKVASLSNINSSLPIFQSTTYVKPGSYTPITKAPNYPGNKKNTKTTSKTTKLTDYVYQEPIMYADSSDYYGGGSGGGGGSYARVPDISGLLAAYDQQADASRKIAQNSYDTTRNDLLTSLKRFQDQNAKDVLNQKQSYLAEQSSLDSAREQANRQNRIAAAARGLGGSGLQQLAQLQTLMAQGEDISDAALTNQKAMDTLKAALQEKEDEYNTNLSKAQTTLDNALSQIEANLAQQKAQTIYENEMAKLSGGSGGGGYGGGGSGSSGFDASVANILDSYNAELGSLAGKTDAEVIKYINKNYGTKSDYGNAYGNAKNMSDVRTILGRVYTDNIGQYYKNTKTNSSTYNNAKNTINAMVGSLQGQKNKNNKNTVKKTTKKTTKKKK